MPFFLPGLLTSVVIGVGGFLLITVLSIEISAAVAFIIASIASGAAVTFITQKSEIAEGSETSEEFTTLYIGNLPYRVNEQAVKDHFAKETQVKSVRLLRDRKTGKRKGFGFIEVLSKEVDKVVEKFNDSEFEDRTLKVRIAKDRSKEE